MINILNNIDHLQLIGVKQPVPQVGSKIIDYSKLKELDSNKIYDFIVDSKGFLRIGKGHYKLNQRNDNLYYAGRLKLNDSYQICYIDNDSGHYIPTKSEMMQFVTSIKKLDFVDNDIKLKNVKIML